MSTHDYNIANQAGAAARADMNAALLAIVSNNSNATEPAVTFAYQFWADTTTGILKQRNAANTAWISILTLSTGKALLAAAADTATNQSGGTVAATTGSFSGLLTMTGGQIKFPATQVPSADANTLDDYEEGGFTPTVRGATTAGASTYSIVSGNYDKFGRAISITLELFWLTATGTGDVLIGTLPFVAAGTVPFTALPSLFALPASSIFGAYVQGFGTDIKLVAVPISGLQSLGASPIALTSDTQAGVYLSGTYFN